VSGKENRMKKLLSLFLMICLWNSAYSEPSSKIAWEPVPGAWGYSLEIRDSSGKIIITKEIRDSYYSVSGFEPGEYSFRIATLNMLKQKGENTGWSKFSVEKLYMPNLKSVSKKQLVSTYSNKKIIISGSNFRKESVFILRGNGTEIKLNDVDVISENEVQINYKPPVSVRGDFDLVVINRGDAESVLKNAVQVVEPSEAQRFYYIGAGYLMNSPSGVWADYMAPSYTGAEIYFQFSLKNPFFENILLEAEVDGVQFTSVETVNTSSLQYVSLGLGAGYYYPVYVLNMELFVKFNTGPMYSVMILEKNVVGRETSSYDWFVMAGAGLRVFIGDSFYIEPACSWKTAFYTGEYLHVREVSVGVGVKI